MRLAAAVVSGHSGRSLRVEVRTLVIFIQPTTNDRLEDYTGWYARTKRLVGRHVYVYLVAVAFLERGDNGKLHVRLTAFWTEMCATASEYSTSACGKHKRHADLVMNIILAGLLILVLDDQETRHTALAREGRTLGDEVNIKY